MNVMTVPRTAAALEYKALRLPSKLVETHVVGRLLAEDSALRLSIERFLASVDGSVGRFLQDEELARRGTAVNRKADALEAAASLEDKAAQRKAAAEQSLQEQKQAAAAKRSQADLEKGEKTARIARKEKADKRAAAAAADAREKAAAEAISSSAQAEQEAEQRRLEKQQDRITTQAKARTAPAEAQLDQAVDRAREASAERSDADRLSELAAGERASRRSEAE